MLLQISPVFVLLWILFLGTTLLNFFFSFALRAQLDEATQELAVIRQSQTQMSKDLSTQTALARETQFRYETEVMRCGQTTKTVKELREKLNSFAQEKSKLEDEKKQAREKIEGLKKNCSALEDKLACLKSQHALVNCIFTSTTTYIQYMSEIQTIVNV